VNKPILLKLFNQNARIAQTFGMKLSYGENDRAIITLPYNPDLDHAGNGIHGGVIGTLLDNAGWFTCALAHKGFVVTSEISFHLLRPAIKTELQAQGAIIKIGKRQIIAEMRCWNEIGNLIAHGTGTFLSIKKSYR
jgi:uncharacterized protein (TIGR00369 family)